MRIANRAGAALLVAALLTLIFVIFVFRRDADRYKSLDAATARVHQIVDTAQMALSGLKDAETGQRGFLITGEESYLEPYRNGFLEYDSAVARLRLLTGNDANVRAMTHWGSLKRQELTRTIDLFREGNAAEAHARVKKGMGKEYMDRFRGMAGQLVEVEESVHAYERRELAALETNTRMKVLAAALTLFLLTLTGTLLLGMEIRRERQIAVRLEVSEKKYRDLAENLEYQVDVRTESLRQLNSELLAFSYSVSHDLRAPLRAIDGFSQIIVEDYADKLDDTGRDMLKRVRAGTKRMGELIQSLLELSRVTRLTPDREPISLSAIAESVLAGLTSVDPARNVEASVQPNLTVRADSELMRVVLDNLLTNAWKFTARTTAARIEMGKMHVKGAPVFFVRDNGAGFDAAHANRLFTPFQRFHSESEFEGTGIGLATVQRIINRHGGHIWAESRKGEGATFFFTL